MRLLHYAKAPVTSVYSTEQREVDSVYGKPRGLWVSADDFEDNWRHWCEAEDFRLECLTHVHEVDLAADAEILRMASAYELDAFTREFQQGEGRQLRINWPTVATRWQGVIIAPYIWERRLHGGYSWYYGWDCASGCIWDARAVASIRLVTVEPIREAA